MRKCAVRACWPSCSGTTAAKRHCDIWSGVLHGVKSGGATGALRGQLLHRTAFRPRHSNYRQNFCMPTRLNVAHGPRDRYLKPLQRLGGDTRPAMPLPAGALPCLPCPMLPLSRAAYLPWGPSHRGMPPVRERGRPQSLHATRGSGCLAPIGEGAEGDCTRPGRRAFSLPLFSTLIQSQLKHIHDPRCLPPFTCAGHSNFLSPVPRGTDGSSSPAAPEALRSELRRRAITSCLPASFPSS